MSHNSFGHLFRFTTWGESHGPAIGCVVDGTPPGITLKAEQIQHWLDRRKPGQSRFVTQRREPDAVQILSGVFEDQTTGTPISLLIQNEDQRSKDYSKSMACATIAAADAPRRARPRAGSPPAPWRAKC
jgi:chorismate synthase